MSKEIVERQQQLALLWMYRKEQLLEEGEIDRDTFDELEMLVRMFTRMRKKRAKTGWTLDDLAILEFRKERIRQLWLKVNS